MGSIQLPDQTKFRAIDNVNVNDDVEHLLKQLTIEEKVQLLAGRDLNSTFPIERLGIPSLKVALFLLFR